MRASDLRLAVFDLDGTLIDSQHDLANSVNAPLHQFGSPSLPHETIATFIGYSIRHKTLPVRRWSLGGLGIVRGTALDSHVRSGCDADYLWQFINVFALAGLTPVIFFLMWPLTRPVTPETM